MCRGEKYFSAIPYSTYDCPESCSGMDLLYLSLSVVPAQPVVVVAAAAGRGREKVVVVVIFLALIVKTMTVK